MKINILLCLLMASLAASKPLVNDDVIDEVDGNEVEETPPHEPRDQDPPHEPRDEDPMRHVLNVPPMRNHSSPMRPFSSVSKVPLFGNPATFEGFIISRANLELMAMGTNEDDAIVINKPGANSRDVQYPMMVPDESTDKRVGWRNHVSCGLVTDRIVGGQNGNPGDFPWLVALKLLWGYHFCGGSLIHPEWVLTAAHCITWGRDVLKIKISIGDHNLKDSGEAASVERGVDKIKYHIKYDETTTDYDIALIKLDAPVDISPDNITPVCLPTFGQSFDGDKATVAGWGRTSTGGPTSDIMKYVDVNVISRDECRRSYRSDRITEQMICAGQPQGGKDACQGDSGGPLFLEKNGQNLQVGIVSWGRGCGVARYPGVYTNVANLMPWIWKHTRG